MGIRGHVGIFDPESFGPAEGQYQAFQDSLVVSNPYAEETPCADWFRFTLSEASPEVCVGVTLPGALSDGTVIFNIFSPLTCGPLHLTEDTWIEAGSTAAETCFTAVAPGTYYVYVYGRDITPPEGYVVSIDSAAGLSGPEKVADDGGCPSRPLCY